MDREAIEEAIEVLEDASAEMLTETGGENYYGEAIAALRQTLETEPFEYWNAVEGWVKIDEVREHFNSVGCAEALRLADALDAEFVQGRISNSTGRESAVELRRLALKQWVGLTDDEIQDLSHLYQKFDESNSPWFDRLGFAKAIEEVLKDKNT